MIDDHLIGKEKWLDAWLWYRGAKHQKEAVFKLYQHIKEADPCLLQENAEWLLDYRSRDKLVKSFMAPEGE
jgi:hypothetical protein